jgi:hypothetical protein
MHSRKRVWNSAFAGIVLVFVCLLVCFLRRAPSPERDKSSKKTSTTNLKPSTPRVTISTARPEKSSHEGRTSIGVLVWPGMPVGSLNRSRTILSWMKEWGFECGFVTVQGRDGADAPSPALPADIEGGARSLSEASSKLNAIVAGDGDLGASEAVALEEYLASGGWAIIPSPEDGGASPEIEELLQLKPSRSATLMLPEPPNQEGILGEEEVRVLVSHQLASGLDVGLWLEWTGPQGKVLYSKSDDALPLLCFARPELPAVRVVSFGEGGVVHWNFPMQAGPLIEETELRTFLGDTLAWLWGRASWAKPLQKEGSVSGIVRTKDGTVIPGAKVTAQVYSEWGEPVQSFEATSSEQGKFSLPILDPGIYWVSAEAEGYYPIDRYLLARPKNGEGEQIEVLMEQEGSISGYAFYGPGEGNPAAGIPITLAPNCRISSAWEKETITDANARFSFNDLPAAQTFYLIAKAEGWMGLQEAPVPLDGGRLETDVHLQSPTRIEGTTVNVVTEQPLAGVEVVVRPARDSGTRYLFRDALAQKALSDEEGKFTLLLPPGSGYWQYFPQVPGFASFSHPKTARIRLSDSGESKPSELRLRFCPNAALHGTIFRSSGEFASGAKVTVAGTEYYCYADEKGQYRTVPMAPTLGAGYARFPLRADWNGETGWGRARFKIASQEKTRAPESGEKYYETLLAGGFPIDVHLKPSEPEPEPSGTTLSGAVLDESGGTVSSAVVELAEPGASTDESPHLGASPRRQIRSDLEGKFDFTAVKEGLWLIRAQKRIVEAGGKEFLYWGEKWLTVSEDTPNSDLQVRLQKAYVRGKVVSADGTPLRDGHVCFEFTFHSGWSQRLELLLGEHGDFNLCPSRGSCRYAALTLPPLTSYKQWADAQVKRWDPEARAAIPWENEERPPEGYVRVTLDLTGGRGGGWVPLKPVEARLGEESLVIRVSPMGSVRGRVIDGDTGSTIAGANLYVDQEDWTTSRRVTDSEGVFYFDRLPTGTYILTCMARGYGATRTDIEVHEEQECLVDIDLRTYYIIRGRLRLKETGQPLVAEIRTMGGNYVSGRDGTFAIVVTGESSSPLLYPFTVFLEGTGLKSVERVVPYSWKHEADVGDILIERETEEQEIPGNTGRNGQT